MNWGHQKGIVEKLKGDGEIQKLQGYMVDKCATFINFRSSEPEDTCHNPGLLMDILNRGL